VNESNRQQSPYSQRQRIGSVPVLFSLRNVQPSIVSGTAPANPSAGTPVVSNGAASTNQTMPLAATVPLVAALPLSNPTKSPSAASSNRAYNVAIGLLVIALCLLVIRNTQGSKTDSKESIAAITATSQVEVKSLANLKVELVPPALPTSTSLKTFEASPKPFEIDLASSQKPTPSLPSSPNLPPSSNLSEDSGSATPGQLLVQDTSPMLLTSTAPSAKQERAEPMKGNAEPVGQPEFSFPETRVAMNPNAPALAEEGLAIVDTNSPPLTTREIKGMYDTNELKEMYKRRNSVAPNALCGQPYPRPDSEPSLPVTTVSNATSVPNRSQAVPDSVSAAGSSTYKPYYTVDSGVKDPGVLAGRPYSTLPQDFPALTVPSYEREALANRQNYQAVPPTTLPIRQPISKEANRYYPSTTQTPYAPLPQVQDGSSFGYPPGR
jgi:hypothetical protein